MHKWINWTAIGEVALLPSRAPQARGETSQVSGSRRSPSPPQELEVSRPKAGWSSSDDNDDDNEDDYDDNLCDPSCAAVPVIHAVQVVLGGAVGGARFFTFLEDNHGPGDHDHGGQDNNRVMARFGYGFVTNYVRTFISLNMSIYKIYRNLRNMVTKIRASK